MLSSLHNRVLPELSKVLKPLVRLLLKCGIGFREFSEIAKEAFVEVATSDYGIRGRPTNVSRVAVMTGLTRKEVKRIRERAGTGTDNEQYRAVPGAEVLHFWHSDPKYLDADGRPIELEFQDGESSFSALVSKYGGDIPPGAMRTELKRTGAIEETDEGRLKVIRRDFAIVDSEAKIVRAFGRPLYAMLCNLQHNNLAQASAGELKIWPERIVDLRSVDSSDLPRVRRITNDHIVSFSESLDDVFSTYRVEDDEEADNTSIVGVGVYYYEL